MMKNLRTASAFLYAGSYLLIAGSILASDVTWKYVFMAGVSMWAVAGILSLLPWQPVAKPRSRSRDASVP